MALPPWLAGLGRGHAGLPRPADWAGMLAAAAVTAVALWVRHAWVQAPHLQVWCAQHPQAHPCPWRHGVIMAFIDHRLSTTALVLAATACLLLGGSRWARGRAMEPTGPSMVATVGRGAAWLGLCVALAGLVLYDADRSALAALLCAVALVPGGAGRRDQPRPA